MSFGFSFSEYETKVNENILPPDYKMTSNLTHTQETHFEKEC